MPLNRPTNATGLRASSLLLGILLLSAGCSQAWFNSFLDPSQTGNFRSNEMVEIQKSISFHDKPMGVPGATEPKPEDTVAIVEEYRIGPSDTLSIRLLDFLQVGAETDLTPLQVNEVGKIFIPQLGLVLAEGRTAYELQQDIVQLAKDAGIYNRDSQPTVTVQVLTAQHRIYNIIGSITNPGTYPITRPDFRILEAITLAGGLDPSVKNIYLFRNLPREKMVREAKPVSAPPQRSPASQPEDIPPAPPVSPMTLSEMARGVGSTAAIQEQNKTTQPTSRLSVPREQAEQELREAISPDSATPPAPSQTTPSATRPATGNRKPNWIYVNDQFIEKPATEPAVPPPSTPNVPPQIPSSAPTTAPVAWEELASEGQSRIIRIPAERLRNGDASYNIAIRNDDIIRLDPGPVGVFYLKGHVARPGTYNFVGEEITVKQAVASAGGFDPLAWPTRCSITRRIDEDREEILQLDLARIDEGKDPDFYLKPNDLVDVGTHAIAPLLATIRNSFRLTYGFGFVYDRNFADIDAFLPQQNPRDIRRATLQSRFPGLFP